MNILVLNSEFSIVKVPSLSVIDLNKGFIFVGKTDEENSVLLETRYISFECLEREDGYKGMRIEGVLEFSLIGVLSKITSILAENKIPVFAVSTYNTDYVFVKINLLEKAVLALNENGYIIK